MAARERDHERNNGGEKGVWDNFIDVIQCCDLPWMEAMQREEETHMKHRLSVPRRHACTEESYN